MEFRPCIDIHNGKVKQIVGGSLMDTGDSAKENFVSTQNAVFYANLYKSMGIKGGHIIILNKQGSDFYEADVNEAKSALAAYPGGLMVGGGITADNARSYIDAGASHVIVTSYVFKDGKIDYDNLNRLFENVGKRRLVLDLSCRRKDDGYYIVTDRWQMFTQVKICRDVLDELSTYCDEFLIHAVDVEGKQRGIEIGLTDTLSQWHGIPITYAGGVGSYKDLKLIKSMGRNQLNVTIGSALDLFGGDMNFQEVLNIINGGKRI